MDETQTEPEKSEQAEKILLETMEYITESLVELNAIENDGKLTAEQYSRKCAFVEILEKLCKWPDAKKHGYDWNVEDEFPV